MEINKIKTLLGVVCKINYKDNCGNCPLRIDGRCKAVLNEKDTINNTYVNIELEPIAREYLKDKSIYIYTSKKDSEKIYLTNGRKNSKGNYLLAQLGKNDSFNILVDEMELINNYKEYSL